MNSWYKEIQDKRQEREDFFEKAWNNDLEKSEDIDIKKSIRIVTEAFKSGKISEELYNKAVKK